MKISDLKEVVLADYKINRRSASITYTANRAFKNLLKWFGTDPELKELSLDRLSLYVVSRLETHSPGTIDLELTIIRRGFSLMARAGRIDKIPVFSGYPGKFVHDLRRTAVRRLEFSGVPRPLAMKLTGHRGENVYARYCICNPADFDLATSRLNDWLLQKTGGPARVSPEDPPCAAHYSPPPSQTRSDDNGGGQ